MALFPELEERAKALIASMHRYPLFDSVVKAEAEVSVHFEYGESPGAILDQYRPNEAKEAWEYRLSSYEQTTYATIRKAVGLLKGSLSNSQFLVIEYPKDSKADKEGQGIEHYLSASMPMGIVNLDSYFWESLFSKSVAYPNSFIAITPEQADYEIKDLTQYRKPYPQFIPSEYVVSYADDYVIVESSEKAAYQEAGKVREGLIYFIFLPFCTFQAIQTGKDTFEIILYHSHGSPTPLCRQVRGEASGMVKSVLSSTRQSLYLSHIQGMIPHLNKILREQSDYDASAVKYMHPVTTEIMLDCPSCGGKDSNCSTCYGAGYISPSSSPLESIVVEPGEGGKIEEAVKFSFPDVSIFSAMEAKIASNERAAYSAIDMEILYDGIGARQTAEAKRMDRDNLLTRIGQVGNTIYPLYQWILDKITVCRYVGVLAPTEEELLNEYRPKLIPPANYDLTAFQDEANRLTELAEAGVNAPTRSLLMKRIVTKSLGPGTDSSKLARTYLNVDPYAGHSVKDIISLGLVGDIESEQRKLQDYIYLNLPAMVDSLLEIYPNYLDLPATRQRELAYNMAAEAMPTPAAPPPVLPVDNQ